MRVKAFVISKYLAAVAVAAAVSAEQREPMRLALLLGALTVVVGVWEWLRDRASIRKAKRLISEELARFLSDGPRSENLTAWLTNRKPDDPLGDDAEKFMRVLKKRNRFPGLIKLAEDADLPTTNLRDCDDAIDELGRFADAWNTGALSKLPSFVALQEYEVRSADLADAAQRALEDVGGIHGAT